MSYISKAWRYIRPVVFLMGLSVIGQQATAQTAGNTVFPQGSSFGLIPFDGATESDSFSGFIHLVDSRSVVIIEMPPEAWAEVYEAFSKKSNLLAQGITAKSIKDVTVNEMKALRISGTQTFEGKQIPKCILLVKGKSKVALFLAQIPMPKNDSDACSMVQGVNERSSINLTQQLTALPFGLGDLGGMRPVVTMGGMSVVFTRGTKDKSISTEQPFLIIASSFSPAALNQNKHTLAKQLLETFAEHKIGKIESTKDLTIDGFPAVEIHARAKHIENPNVEVHIIQWMVYTPDGNYVRLIGGAASDKWADTLPRLKIVRDGLDVREHY